MDARAEPVTHERRAAALAAAVVAGFTVLSVLRYLRFGNETFDLAFYTRIAWGLVRGELYEPIVGAHVFGLRLSLVLVPVGALGALGSTPIALLCTQGLAAALAARPLAALGARALGPAGAYAAALGYALHPNLGRVLAYEAHPGTIALLPLAWLALAVERRDGRAALLATLGVLACREDFAPMTAIACALVAASPVQAGPDADRASGARGRRLALAGVVASVLWLAFFLLVLLPRHRPAVGSLDLHFGPWGGSPFGFVRSLVSDPAAVLAHLAAPARRTYLLVITAPLALLPLLAPRALLCASPILAINLISCFPTTTRIDSHYLTPALPFLVAGAVAEAPRTLAALRLHAPRALGLGLLLAATAGYLVAGELSPGRGTPGYLRPATAPSAIHALLARIPADASVEAPDALLPHLAERRTIHRRDGYAGDDDVVVLDLFHRPRFLHDETLLRTAEEPVVRALLARPDRRVIATAGPYALVERRAAGSFDPLAGLRLDDAPAAGQRLTSCLTLRGATRSARGLRLALEAHGPCPTDLAVRLSDGGRTHTDLLFDGLVSPASLRAGDLVRSEHALAPRAGRVEVGVLRASGARPDPTDPPFVEVVVDSTPSAAP